MTDLIEELGDWRRATIFAEYDVNRKRDVRVRTKTVIRLDTEEGVVGRPETIKRRKMSPKSIMAHKNVKEKEPGVH